MIVTVGWAPILAPWPPETLRSIEPLLPARQFADCLRFRRWQDRQAKLLARLILREILLRHEVGKTLDDIETTDEGRPFIPEGGDFSIAHTTTLALCAWVPQGRIGIDVETSRATLKIEDLMPWMSDAERDRIGNAPTPMDEATLLWTAKEAVCKADGCGIASGQLPDCVTDAVAFRGNSWLVRSRRRRGHWFSLAVPAAERSVCRSFRLRLFERAQRLDLE